MSSIEGSKRAIRVITKKMSLPLLIHHLIDFRVFKAHGVELAIIT
jgi:spore maturation protein SpmB